MPRDTGMAGGSHRETAAPALVYDRGKKWPQPPRLSTERWRPSLRSWPECSIVLPKPNASLYSFGWEVTVAILSNQEFFFF